MKLFNQKPKIEFLEEEGSEFIAVADYEKLIPFEEVFIDPITQMEHTKPIINPIIFQYMSEDQRLRLTQNINLIYKKQEIYKMLISNSDEESMQSTLLDLNRIQFNLPVKQFLQNQICSEFIDQNKTEYLDYLFTDPIKTQNNQEKDFSIISNILLCFRYHPSEELDLFDNIQSYQLEGVSDRFQQFNVVFINGLNDCAQLKKYFEIKKIDNYQERYLTSKKHFLFVVKPAIIQKKRYDFLFIISHNKLDDLEQLQLIYMGICRYFSSQFIMVSETNIEIKKVCLIRLLQILSKQNYSTVSGYYGCCNKNQNMFQQFFNSSFNLNNLEKILFGFLGLIHHNPYFSIYAWDKIKNEIENYISVLINCEQNDYFFLKYYKLCQSKQGQIICLPEIIGVLKEQRGFTDKMKQLIIIEEFRKSMKWTWYQIENIKWLQKFFLCIMRLLLDITIFCAPILNFYFSYNYNYLLCNYLQLPQQWILFVQYITVILHLFCFSFSLLVAIIFIPGKILVKKILKTFYFKKSEQFQEVEVLDENNNTTQSNQNINNFGKWEEKALQSTLNEEEKQMILDNPQQAFLKRLNITLQFNTDFIYQQLSQFINIVEVLLILVELISLILNFGIQQGEIQWSKVITFIIQIFFSVQLLFSYYLPFQFYQQKSFKLKFTSQFQNFAGAIHLHQNEAQKLQNIKELGKKVLVNFFLIIIFFNYPYIFSKFKEVLFGFSLFMIFNFIINYCALVCEKIKCQQYFKKETQLQFQSSSQPQNKPNILRSIDDYEDTILKFQHAKKDQNFISNSKTKIQFLVEKQEDIIQFLNSNQNLVTSPLSSTRIKYQFLESSKIAHSPFPSQYKDIQQGSQNISQLGLIANSHTTRSQI